ncbi:coproporphyrinogen III oxidase [compost metagenome]
MPETIETLDHYDRFNEYIMTSLRTMWGTSLNKIEVDFGKIFLTDTLKNIKPFIERKWLASDKEHLTLTLDGKLFADHIASELFLIPEDHN